MKAFFKLSDDLELIPNNQDTLNWMANRKAGEVIEFEVKDNARTLKQNRSMHLYFRLLADALNEAGLDMRKVLKPAIDIPWTTDSVKQHLWKPIQKIMLDTESTTKLNTKGPKDVYLVLDRHIAEKHGIHIEWPCRESQENEAMGYK